MQLQELQAGEALARLRNGGHLAAARASCHAGPAHHHLAICRSAVL